MANRYGLQIRAAHAADALGLTEVFKPVVAATTADVLAARLENLRRSGAGVALIAVEWGPPTGLVVVNWFPTLVDDLQVAQIDLMLVAPHERRRGVGRLLLKAASQAARTAGCGSMRMASTHGSDASLRAFCEATGFDADGQLYARVLRKKA